jgi:hypothetical protein
MKFSTNLNSKNYTFDVRDQLSRVTDPHNLVTRMTTSGLGNLTALTAPDTGST